MPSAIGRAAVAPVLATASIRAEQVTQLLLGETASIVEHFGEWCRLSIHVDGYNGWVHSGYLQELDESAVAEWRSRAQGWSDGALIRVDGSYIPLPLRSRVILEAGTVILPDGRRGRVSAGAVRQLSEVRAEAGTKAPDQWVVERFLGSPYLWGGVTPWGVDCSGLVQTTFAARGVMLPRDAALQVEHGTPIAAEDIRPGDLLFFQGESTERITHVAFAAEDDGLIHSTLPCGGGGAESWPAGTRAEPLRDRLVAVRRMETR